MHTHTELNQKRIRHLHAYSFTVPNASADKCITKRSSKYEAVQGGKCVQNEKKSVLCVCVGETVLKTDKEKER